MIPNSAITLPEPEIIQQWIEAAAKEYNGGFPIPFYPTTDHPASYKALVQWAENNRVGVDPLPVYSGGSEGTIFGTAQGNYLFRAWHDAVHVKERLAFTLQDELKVADIHCEILKYIGAPYAVVKAIEADVKGQIYYYFATKQFVGDQLAFVSDCLRYGIERVIETVKNGVTY